MAVGGWRLAGGVHQEAFIARDFDLVKPMQIQMPPQGGQDVCRVGPDNKTQLTGGTGLARDGVLWGLRHAAMERQHGKGIPAEDSFGLRQISLSPVGVNGGAVRTVQRQIADRCVHVGGEARWSPLGHRNLPACIGDAGQRM